MSAVPFQNSFLIPDLLKNNLSRVFFIKVLFGFPWIGDSIIVVFFFLLFFLFWSFFFSFNSLIFFTSVDLPFFDVTSINGTTSLIALFGTSSGIITERFFLDFPTSVTASVGEYVNTLLTGENDTTRSPIVAITNDTMATSFIL